MRYASGHKAQTRTQIVEAAARVFRASGVAGASVGQIMGEAGLTVGGFYAHFKSKDDLLAEALPAAFAQSVEDRCADLQPDEPDWVNQFVERYLSDDHLHDIGNGCPMAALTSEISRTDGTARESFAAGLAQFVELLTQRLDEPGERGTDMALAIAALCVGGMSLARATDDHAAERILKACKAAADALQRTSPT